MPDLFGGEAALRRIHLRYARTVVYTMPNQFMIEVPAVRSHGPAGLLMDDQTPRQLTFEIRKEDLPGIPNEGDTLIEDDGRGARWTVTEYTDLDDVDAWRVVVVKA